MTLSEDRKIQDSRSSRKCVDLTVVCKEIRLCQRDHAHCAGQPLFSSAGPMEILLVDVDQACLVTGSTSASYVCLSYVWGKDVWLQTTSENISVLRTPGALSAQQVQGLPPTRPRLDSDDSDDEFFGDLYQSSHARKSKARAEIIPTVIRDAMEVVQSLGERYLWVDSLCIIQDDTDSKNHQIQGMGVIYSAALMTIVALSGMKASHGLGDHFQRNEQWYHSEDQYGADFMTCSRGPRSEALYDMMRNLKMSYYSQRAWTFQEYLLSRRCLFFYSGKDRPFFLCRNDQSFSTGTPSSDLLSLLLNPLSPHAGHSNKLYNGFRKYGHLVQQYTFKELSHPEDKVNAFAGILQGLLCYYELGKESWMGLPSGVLDFALLWAPIFPGRDIVHSEPYSENNIFPTWSWASQSGQVEYDSVGIEEAQENCWWPCVKVFHYRQLPHSQTTSYFPRSRTIVFNYPSEEHGLNNVLVSAGTMRCQPASFTNTSNGENESIAAHTLEFTAFCVKAAGFYLTSSARGPYRSSRFILATAGDTQPCGIILADAMFKMDLAEARSRFEAAHLVLISQSYRPFLEIEGVDEYNIRHGSADGWENVRKRTVCNVLMVDTTGPYVRRTGIGKIDLRAWEMAKAELRLIRLG